LLASGGSGSASAVLLCILFKGARSPTQLKQQAQVIALRAMLDDLLTAPAERMNTRPADLPSGQRNSLKFADIVIK
jgi:hypothetical protein